LRYVYSKYLYIINDDKGVIMYSTKTGNIVYLEKIEFEDVKSYLDGEIQANDTINYMIEYGFLVSDETDEVKSVIDEHVYSIENSKIFHLTVYLTEECNFNCEYCFVKKSGRIMEEQKFGQLYRLLEKKINQYSGIDISWFGGEPLIRIENLIEYNKKIYHFCEKNGKKYNSSIVTNGYYLTLHNFLKLYDNNIRNIQVTFDGAENKHDSMRLDRKEGASFDIIIRNLRKIQKMAFHEYYITIRCNYEIGKEMTDSKEFLKLYDKFFSRDKRFSLVLKPIVNYDEIDEQKLLSIYKGKTDALCDIIGEYTQYADLLMELIRPRKYWCNSYSCNSYVVNAMGEIYMCDAVINRQEYKLGFITEDGDIKIQKEYKLYSKVKEHLLKELKGCLNCKRLPVCYGSCNKIYHLLGKRACSINDSDIEKLLRMYVRIYNERIEVNENNIKK